MSASDILKWTGLGFMVLGPLLSILMFRLGFGYLKNARAVRSWPSVTATVLVSSLEKHTDHEGYVSYRPHVGYSYQVTGQTYQSENLHLFDLMGGHKSIPENDAQRTIDQYPVGKQVTAYYDPKDPSRAVLSTTMSNAMIAVPFGMGLFMLFGFLLGGGAMVYFSR